MLKSSTSNISEYYLHDEKLESNYSEEFETIEGLSIIPRIPDFPL